MSALEARRPSGSTAKTRSPSSLDLTVKAVREAKGEVQDALGRLDGRVAKDDDGWLVCMWRTTVWTSS